MTDQERIERFQVLKDKKTALAEQRAGVSSLLDQNKRRVDSIREELTEKGVDPDKVDEYLEGERGRLDKELDEFEVSLEAAEDSLTEVSEALEAIS